MTWQQSGHLSVGGTSMHCACVGLTPADAPTIVLLHEGLGCVELWRDFPQQLVAMTGCGVVAYSRAGYGQSDLAELPRPLDYMTREATDVLPHVLDQLGIDNAVLIGHSDGATIAAIYAGSVPDERVRGLVVMAPHFFTEPNGLAAIADARDAYATGGLRERMAKYHRDPDNTFRGWNDAWLDPGFVDWNVTDVIEHIAVPTLAIQGVDDQYGTARQVDVIAELATVPVEILMLDDCKHSPHLEQPDATVAAITQFCASLPDLGAPTVGATRK